MVFLSMYIDNSSLDKFTPKKDLRYQLYYNIHGIPEMIRIKITNSIMKIQSGRGKNFFMIDRYCNL